MTLQIRVGLCFYVLSCLFGALGSGLAQAQSAAVVEGVQLPAWVQRGAEQLPLQPGMELVGGDRLKTGSSGKLLVRMAEGSHVKLGVNASLNFKELQPAPAGGVFNGFLRVLNGAFRFTTSALGNRKRRNIQVQVGVATAGIRGTDIWGKSDKQRDLICLIEGQIDVSRENEAPVNMNKPLTVYTAPRAAAADPLWTVSNQELAQWAVETELDNGQGILLESGEYIVYLASSSKRARAQAFAEQIRAAGYPAEVFAQTRNDKPWFRIGIQRFASGTDAKRFAAEINGQFGIKGAWAARM